MYISRRISKPISCLMTLAMVWLGMYWHTANAVMIGTEAVLNEVQGQGERERVRSFLNREDVRAELEDLGINPLEAQARVDSLTDDEIAYIAGKLDQLPAGGSAVGPIVGALVFVFVLLLVTDLLGLTRVFPFVRHPPRR